MHRFRKLLLSLLALMLLLGAAVSASAATYSDRKLCYCGNSACSGSVIGAPNGAHKMVTWKPWTDPASLPASGNYYLTCDVTLTAACELGLAKTLAIDLNGYTIRADGALRLFDVAQTRAALILTDSSATKTGKLDYTGVSGTQGYGLAIRLNKGSTTVSIYGGTITGTRFAGTGGAAVILGSGSNATTTVLNLYGGTITGGAGAKGGNVFVHNGVFNMYGGTISDGKALGTGLGGNIFLNNLSATGTSATFNMQGGSITGGSAVLGCSIYAHGYAKVNLKGGSITGAAAAENTGAVHILENATLTLSGDLRIWGNQGSNVYLPAGKVLSLGGNLRDNACIGVTLGDYTGQDATSREFTTATLAQESLKFFQSDDASYGISMGDSGLVLRKSGSCRLNGQGKLVSFDDCAQMADASKKEFVQLTEDLPAVTIDRDTYLDLNGFSIATAEIAEGATLYAFDSTTADYQVDMAAPDYGRIGSITGGGTLAQVFLNHKNHRYLTLADGDGYSFHRFYLAVTHCVLSRNYTGLTYQIKLTCNEKLAASMEEVGIHFYLDGEQYMGADGTGNLAISGMEIRPGGMVITVVTRNPISFHVREGMEAEQKICAYMTLGSNTVTCAFQTVSFRQLFVKLLEEKWDSGLDVIQQDVLAAFYRKYGKTANMDNWSNLVTEKLKPMATAEQASDCICGDLSATGTPCANAGHAQLEWTLWAGPELPTAAGNYRLTCDLDVTKTLNVGSNRHIILDLNGHTVRQTKAETPLIKLHYSKSALTLTDHAGGGRMIPVSANADYAYGMTISLNYSTAEFHMYGGILDCRGKTARYGLGITLWKGKAFMYGGAITGGRSETMGAGGGNVLVYQNAIFRMYGGIIENGVSYDSYEDTTKGGGNIRISTGGTAYIYGGIIRGGEALVNHGGNIHNAGTLYLYGGEITGGKAAGTGGGISNTGNLYLSGAPVVVGNEKTDLALLNNTRITLSGSGLEQGARVGVNAASFTGPFTTQNSAATAANARYFFSSTDPFATATATSDGLAMRSEGYSAGYAAVNINPDPSLYGKVGLMGYDNNATRLVTAVDEENPLMAICTAVSDGNGGIVLLISVDTGALGTNIPTNIAAYAEQVYGISKYRVVMSSNHQHSTPSFNNGYQTQVIAALKQLVDEAIADLHPVTAMETQTVDVGANQFNFVRNYQYLDANGNPIPGAVSAPNHDDGKRTDIKGTTNGMTYESTGDSNVVLLRITREAAPDVLVMNFQVHPLLLTSSSSTVAQADVVGHFRQQMEKNLHCKVMYINGAAGNLATSSSIEAGKGSYDMASSNYGMRLGNAVATGIRADGWVDAMGEGTPLATTVQATHACQVRLNSDDIPTWLRSTNPNFASYTDAQLLEAMLTRAQQLHTGSAAKESWTVSDLNQYGIYSIYHAKHIVQRMAYSEGDTIGKNISVAVFGDVAFAIAPYEMFDTNGLQIKEGSPYAATFIMTMATVPNSASSAADGVSGYIPSLLAYENGGYSTDITHFAAGTGEALAQHYLELLYALK